MKILPIVATAAIIVMASAVIDHYQNAPTLPSYYMQMGYNTTNGTILGVIAIEGYAYNISFSSFNVTLKGFQNYTIQFSQLVEYGGVENTTAHVYLKDSISFQVTPVFNSSLFPKGGIYIN